MKIGIVVAYHNFVNKFILPCLNSILSSIKHEKIIYVFDNESSHKDNYKVADFCNINNEFNYIRIDDQNKNGGLTAVWNKGVDLCIHNECDIIFIINDDILINETWACFVSSITEDNTIYGPLTNNPGHAWTNKNGVKIQYSNNRNGRHEDPIKVGFINGFCFGCTSKTFVNNMYDEKHYFNPYFPFGGNETEFQIRLFNLKPTSDKKQNQKILDLLDLHNRAVIVPKCYVYHYKNNAWRISGGGKYSKYQFS
tara:strand:- start:1884 stop:2642 length:759 start_codon:yes stop_codon:yes gene_type:complete